MLFSSILFIYYFLPLLLVIYYLVKNKYRNFILLIFSIAFYFLGEPKYIIILLLSCILNYYASKLIETKKYKKTIFLLAILYNIVQLLFFKYTDFFIENINLLFNTDFPYLYIVMPIGISFFTFQALGYIIDVYNEKHKPASNIIDFMTYICLFPQLVAGPIVRYIDIEKFLKNRKYSFDNFANGIKRFIIGLSKKVLLANVLGEFSTLVVSETLLASWLKPITYTLQIYFDFSGYSDMAIGLGLMFGFKFLENFNYPLIASSITDFWRRWHISLSSWLRDYIYIPLGGNRVTLIKWLRNIFVVWTLTGFWHGASWNFIIWGLYFGIILVIEKIMIKKYIDKTLILKHIYTLIIIIISFLIFNSNSIMEIITSLKNMFLLNKIPIYDNEVIYYLRSYILIITISIVSSTPLFKNIFSKIQKTKYKFLLDFVEPIFYIILITLCTAFLIDASFNPFLYFRF